MNQVVQFQPRKQEALSSHPSTKQNKTKNPKQQQKEMVKKFLKQKKSNTRWKSLFPIGRKSAEVSPVLINIKGFFPIFKISLLLVIALVINEI